MTNGVPAIDLLLQTPGFPWSTGNTSALGPIVPARSLGIEPGDATVNVSIALAEAIPFIAGHGVIGFEAGDYYMAPTTPIANGGAAGNTASIVIASSFTTLLGVRGKTRFVCLSYGMRDPALFWETYAPVTTPMQRSHAYTTGERAFANGHTYRATNNGTTAPPSFFGVDPSPSGVFSGTRLDGTVQWGFADMPYRGGGILIATGVTDVTIDGIWLDGGCSLELAPPTVGAIPAYTSTYDITDETQAPQVIQGNYNDYTFASGFDGSHKGIWIGGPTGTGCTRINVRNYKLTRWRGEPAYGDGARGGGTVLFEDGDISDSTGSGISVGGKLTARRTTFTHMRSQTECFPAADDQLFEDLQANDCCLGMQISAQAAVEVENHGKATIRGCVSRNVYAYCVMVLGYARGVDVFDNWFYDFAKVNSTTHAAILISGFFGGNPRDIQVRRNHFVTDKQSGLIGIFLQTQPSYVDLDDNTWVRSDYAVANGKELAFCINFILDPGTASVRWRRNRFRDANGPDSGGSVSYAGFHGLFQDNTYDTGSSRDLQTVAGGATVYPHNERVFVAGAIDNTIVTVASLANATQFDDGQLVEILQSNSTRYVLFPVTGAGHAFPGVRLVNTLVVRFIVRLDATLGKWVEHRYQTVLGKAPTANDVAPAFQTIVSEAPLLQTWGCAEVTLAPVGPTTFSDGRNFPPGVAVHVICNANATIGHNVGGATIKIFMNGGANFVGPGEIFLMLNAAGTQVREVSRMA